MARYFILEIQTNSDGSVTFPSNPKDKIFTEQNQAEAEYHKILQYAAVSSTPYKGCMLLTNKGEVLRAEFYEHTQEQEQEE